MKKEDLKTTDDILNSIEGIRQASPREFFYTRLRARMEKERPVAAVSKRFFQPAIIISGLVLLLLINVLVLLRNGDNGFTVTTSGKDNDNIQIVATAYHINEASPIELNQ
ncbi:MAG TPA: hypothetical protein VG676_16830 [Chitinophagaceae bacterium]|jgi:hypothetical protein|nr:hypothetical protein [Chitinophagaceae bacterium]